MEYFKRLISIVIIVLITTNLSLLAENKKDKTPNIIIFFTDDQGYQDVGCFGSPLIKTPNFDRMAGEGMRFTDFYSASPVCSPSRAALLTGCYPPRVGVTRVLFPGYRDGLDQKEVTIADMLKEKGYATACIGKWHLGDKPEYMPAVQGFDSYYGIPYSNDMKGRSPVELSQDALLREGMTLEGLKTLKFKKNKVPLWRDDKVIEFPVDQTTLTKRYTEEAIKFVTENRNNPFFLYLPHTMPHIPLFASKDFLGKSARGLYGDVIEELDWSMGEILKTLKTLGIDDNTLVVFTSDNGPWNLEKRADLKNEHGGCALPLRGFKFQTYEGGMRVPMIAWWPGKIPAGTECSEIASTIDLLPTIAHITDSKKPKVQIDGKNIWPLMSHKKGAKSPHDAYFYYAGTKLQAVRSGEWKLRYVDELVELYNLDKDISESNNVAEDNPKIVKKLTEIMEEFDKDLKLNVH